MSKVHLREPSVNGTNGIHAPEPIALKPLRAVGVVVRKADMVEAMRIYAPGLVDIRITEDGEHFWLMLDGGGGR